VSLYDITVDRLLAVGRAAEAAGFDSVWLGEHLVLPVAYRSAHPSHSAAADATDSHYPRVVHEQTRLADPMVALAALAASTVRVRLGTAIYLLPLRHPLVTARAAATLQQAATGRFLLGVGAGWLQEEFDALDVDFAGRGRRHLESVELVRAALAGGPIDYDGEVFSTHGVQVSPDAVHVPIVMGGNSPVALRRAARLADGWFASANPTFEQAVEMRDTLKREAASAGRQLPECFVRTGRFEPAEVGRYADAGFENLVFWAQDICPPGRDPDEAFAEAAARLGI
jgi:probable F420-dependent oxidoreductase